MSEEYKRTKKEVELDLKIKQAELDQKLAEIEKTKAETEKMQSEAGKAYLDYEKLWGLETKIFIQTKKIMYTDSLKMFLITLLEVVCLNLQNGIGLILNAILKSSFSLRVVLSLMDLSYSTLFKTLDKKDIRLQRAL